MGVQEAPNRLAEQHLESTFAADSGLDQTTPQENPSILMDLPTQTNYQVGQKFRIVLDDDMNKISLILETPSE